MGNPQNVIKPLADVPPTWLPFVALFRSFLHAGNLSNRYIEDCIGILRRFAIATGAAPTEVTLAHLLEYINSGFSPGTMYQLRSVFQRFFGMLHTEDLIPRNPSAKLPKVKVPVGKPRPFTVAQVGLLLNGVSGGRPAYARTRAMILLGYFQGWRVAEIARAAGEQFDLQENVVRYIAKGSKFREQALTPTIAALAATMPRRGYWFPGQTGEGHVLPKSVSSLLANRISTVGIDDPRLTAHSLRHACATELVAAGVDIRVIAEFLGHENPATTMRYTKVDLSQQIAAAALIPTLDESPHATALAAGSAIPRLEDLRRASAGASRHGTPAAYRTGCRCDLCRDAHALANRQWRANRVLAGANA
ncbi:tyrosine-type recombinase/integrase [Microbacterium paraoxydans]|uniref:tyrosine-type recombinase/integrase n=1 Tax=Microbacterium paraoxydans TaxID=199592 RepID=UPI001CFB2350|nr:tyrosine-type recombinase/integrase [Microbacterium paraoxydans]